MASTPQSTRSSTQSTPRWSTRSATPIVDMSLTANRRRDPTHLIVDFALAMGWLSVLLVWLERGVLHSRGVKGGIYSSGGTEDGWVLEGIH